MKPLKLPLALLLAVISAPTWAQEPAVAPTAPPSRERELAARFAPIFHQRLTPQVETHRFDYITSFDFDGDWVGTNNWANAAETRYSLPAYIYYSVVETQTHYFLTYAVFHPRDWSLAQPLYEQTLDLLRGKYPEYFPASARASVEFNHENDLEGVLVVARKTDDGAGAHLEAVETLAHNRFYKYLAPDSALARAIRPEQRIMTEGDHPVVYIESQKHGIKRYEEQDRRGGPVLIYRFTGTAEVPKAFAGEVAYAPARAEVGYDLLPIYDSLWMRARASHEPNETFGEIYDFGSFWTAAVGLLGGGNRQVDFQVGAIGVALRGEVAAKNKARLPWGWFDSADRTLKVGEWFFDPAKTLLAHFPGARGVSQRYVSNPYLGINREGAR